MAEYKVFYKKVNHPIPKVFAVFMLFTLLIILSPILIPGHFILRAVGRNGFYFNNKIQVEKIAFKKRLY